jgi:excisionase family DNA binding protein
MADDALLTVRQFADRLHMHPATVRIWLRDGKIRGMRLPADKLGWRIPESEVDRVLAEAAAAGAR